MDNPFKYQGYSSDFIFDALNLYKKCFMLDFRRDPPPQLTKRNYVNTIYEFYSWDIIIYSDDKLVTYEDNIFLILWVTFTSIGKILYKS